MGNLLTCMMTVATLFNIFYGSLDIRHFFLHIFYISVWIVGEFICTIPQFSDSLWNYFRVHHLLTFLFSDFSFYIHDFKLLIFLYITLLVSFMPIYYFQKCIWLLFYFISPRISNYLYCTNLEPGLMLRVELNHYSNSGCIVGCVDKPVGNSGPGYWLYGKPSFPAKYMALYIL